MAWFQRKFSGDELLLSNAMMHYWTQFAKTGDPNDGTYPHWPLYDGGIGGKKRLQLDVVSGEKNASDTDEVCAFWRDLADKK